MELNDSTVQVLKNFSSINQNIVFQPGNTVRTVSEAKNIMCKATLDTEFQQQFGVYDLSEFLNVVSLVDQPRLKFEPDYVVVGDSSGVSRAKYFFSDPSMLTSPSKDVKMPDPEVTFTLSSQTLSKVKRAASVLGHTEVSISVVDKVLSLSVVDSNNTTSNTFSVDVDGDYQDSNFNFIVNIENLKLVPGDYKVEMSSKLISHFVNLQTPIEYWIALEKTSFYGE